MKRTRLSCCPWGPSALVVVFVCVGFLCGCPSTDPPDRNVLIMATPTLLDFGTTEEALVFEVWKNDTSQPLPAFTVSADQDWISVNPTGGESSGPDERVQVNAVIDRSDLVLGLNRGTITIQAPGVTSTTLDVKALSGVSGSTEIGPNGGIVEGPEDSAVEIAPGELTEEIGFALRIPEESEILEDLASAVPYEGVLRVDAWRTLVSSEADATDGSFEMAVRVPLLTPLGPGVVLDVYVGGSLPGEWMLLDTQATVDENGTTASFTTNQVGVFLVRFTDAFTVPTVDLFEEVTKQGHVPELGYGLHKVEDGGTGMAPILLIHGAGGELETQAEGEITVPGKVYARWDTFIDWAKGPDGLAGTSDDNIDLANKFQLWWFLHDSELPVGYDPTAFIATTENNAQQLADALDGRRVETTFPDADQQFIIMAHGRGGLVARAFMEEVDWAGDQTMMAISLGGPHHGSSFGVADWAFYLAKTNFSLPIADDLLPAQNLLAGLNQVMTPWYEPGGSDMAWDNFDNASLSQTYGFGVPSKEFALTTQRPGVEVTQHTLSTNDAGWPSDANLDDEDMELPPLYGNRRRSGETLWDLNHNAEANRFIRKFLLYAGYLTEFDGPGTAAGFWGWDRFDNDTLQASCAVMARFVSEGTEMPLHGANDGYASVQSALYLRGSMEEPVFVPMWRAGIVPDVKTPVELDMEAIDARLRVPANHAFVFPDYTNLDLVTGQLHDDDDTNDTVLFDNYVRPNLEITLLSVPTASFFIASRDGGTVTIDTSTSQDNETLLWPATQLEYRVNWGDGQVSSWTADPPTKHIYVGDALYAIKLQVRDKDGMMGTSTRQVVVTGSSGGEDVMVDVPEGMFTLGPRGAFGSYLEMPPHTVYLDRYQIGKYEVTNEDYAEILNYALGMGYLRECDGDPYVSGDVCASGRLLLKITESTCQIEFSGGGFVAESRDGYAMEDHPVVQVTWYGAVAYTNWLSETYGYPVCYDLTTWERIEPVPAGFRLSTEAEWERAAAWDPFVTPRSHWIYGFQSDAIGPTRCNYNSRNPLGLTQHAYTTPIGYHNGINRDTVNSVSPVGAYDMTGNIWEWCHDWLSAYPLDEFNPTGRPFGDRRVLRGGGWNSDEIECRTAWRGEMIPNASDKAVGFRVARTVIDK